MKKVIIIMIFGLFTLGLSANFTFAVPAAPAPAHQCNTTKDCTGPTEKCVIPLNSNVRTCVAGKKNSCVRKDVAGGGSGYEICDTAGGLKEIKGYICRSGAARGGMQEVRIPSCTVGGIFDMNDDDIKCACCGQCPLSRFLGLFITISKWILGLSGSAALLVIVYGGFMWILSGGDPKKIETGKQALTGAVIGVIIVLGAWLMVDQGLKAMTRKGIDAIQVEYKANLK